MNKQLAKHEYLAGDYSIADIACWPWAILNERQGQNIDDFPHVKRWIEAIGQRPAAARGQQIGQDYRRNIDDDESRSVLFNQTAR